jgi:ubiquinone/menaquinone biosynthesis C-methylase UbiE
MFAALLTELFPMPIPRVLEPEVMDSQQDAIDYDSMDHREVNRRFVDDLLKFVRIDGSTGWILDVGTGTAQIAIELVRACSTANVHAVDLAEEMLVLAARNVRQAGFENNVRLERIDAKGLPWPDGHFTGVMSNSIVHHIPEPLGVLREAVRVVQPGGWVFFRDLARPDSLSQLKALVETYAGDANPHQRQLFDDSLHAALTVDEVRRMVKSLGFAAGTVELTSDRHWTWATIKAG